MCGRFTQKYTWEKLHRLYRLTQPARNLRPRYNICPTDPVDVIVLHDGALAVVPMRWQLIPSWWKKSLKDLPATFNARAETVAEAHVPGCVQARPMLDPGVWVLQVADHTGREAAVLHHVGLRAGADDRGLVERVARPSER